MNIKKIPFLQLFKIAVYGKRLTSRNFFVYKIKIINREMFELYVYDLLKESKMLH